MNMRKIRIDGCAETHKALLRMNGSSCDENETNIINLVAVKWMRSVEFYFSTANKPTLWLPSMSRLSLHNWRLTIRLQLNECASCAYL